MVERAAARRYAEAFVSAAENAGKLQDGLEEIKAIAQIYSTSKPLQRFLGSPQISPEDKERVIHRLWGEAASRPTLGLLNLLLDWDRVDHLPVLAEEAKSVAEARQGILRGRVVTAHPISSAEMEAVARGLGRLLHGQVFLERSVDPAILGGIRVTVGTTLLDASVRTMLEEVRTQLKQVKVA